MAEVGLALDHKDFVADGYYVNAKAIGKKRKALASASQCEAKGMEEEKEHNVDEEEDNLVDLTNDEIDSLGGSELPMGGAHLTSPNVDMEIMFHRRNVMILRSFFPEDLVIMGAKPGFFGPSVETWLAKKAKQHCTGSTAGRLLCSEKMTAHQQSSNL